MAYGFPLQKSYNITNQLTFQGSKFSGREIDITIQKNIISGPFRASAPCADPPR